MCYHLASNFKPRKNSLMLEIVRGVASTALSVHHFKSHSKPKFVLFFPNYVSTAQNQQNIF